MWLSGPHVSFGPTEQQRVMLLSRSPSGPKKYFPIPVAHLEEEIRVRSADDCKRFREEFNVSGVGGSSVLSWGGIRGQVVPYFRIRCLKTGTLASVMTLFPKRVSGDLIFAAGRLPTFVAPS